MMRLMERMPRPEEMTMTVKIYILMEETGGSALKKEAGWKTTTKIMTTRSSTARKAPRVLMSVKNLGMGLVFFGIKVIIFFRCSPKKGVIYPKYRRFSQNIVCNIIFNRNNYKNCYFFASRKSEQ